jgi:phosphoribosylaminoimidazole-succinocarboxamide synthase
MLFPTPFNHSDLPLSGKRQGKVRDIYPLGDDHLLLVTTDRLSAFDRILGAAAYRGQVLNQLSAWWFKHTADIVPNHMLAVPDPNAMIVQAVDPLPIEVVVRGYITGTTKTALWYRYSLGESVIYGHRFPAGLRKNRSLPQPIITPTTKGGSTGHDERLTVAEVVDRGYLDSATWQTVQDVALRLFCRGQQIAARGGLILVDTKYEFGRAPDGRILLIDEVHTPDSSRFWLAETYASRLETGEEPENYDKEFLRLAYAAKGYRGDGDPPDMPAELWEQVSQRYIDLYERLTDQSFQPASYPVEDRLQKLEWVVDDGDPETFDSLVL